MPSLTRQSSGKSSASYKSSSTKTSATRDSRRSSRTRDSYDSQSTSPTSLASSSRPSHASRTTKHSHRGAAKVVQHHHQQQHQQHCEPEYQYHSQQQQQEHQYQQPAVHEEHVRQKAQQPHADFADLSPFTRICPRSSAETYTETGASREDLAMAMYEGGGVGEYFYPHGEIPPLPAYQREPVEPHVLAATPREFASLFPSMNRLSIRHDEFTADGNMNLRIDTPVLAGRRRAAMQLFHLRMHDLARREFSLRRYCRDSGREVCNSKRKYTTTPAPPAATAPVREDRHEGRSKGDGSSRPSLSRFSAFFKSFSSSSSRPQSKKSSKSSTSLSSSSSKRSHRKNSAWSSPEQDEDNAAAAAAVAVPTNTIKLEFSNYARVDLERRGKSSSGTKRYDFDWWGHAYSWRRTTDRHTGAVSFHLVRDGRDSEPVAHVVPETRSPVQEADDEAAGGWVPPCHMWISDPNLLSSATDVADVVVATALIALVDDCIKEHWETRRIHRISVPLTSRTVDVEYVGARAFMQHVFGRRQLDPAAPEEDAHASPSPEKEKDKQRRHHKHDHNHKHNRLRSNPLRHGQPVAVF